MTSTRWASPEKQKINKSAVSYNHACNSQYGRGSVSKKRGYQKQYADHDQRIANNLYLFHVSQSPLKKLCRRIGANRINGGHIHPFNSSNFYTQQICVSRSFWVRVCLYGTNIAVIPVRNRVNYTITLNNIWLNRTARIYKFRILIANSSFTFRGNIA